MGGVERRISPACSPFPTSHLRSQLKKKNYFQRQRTAEQEGKLHCILSLLLNQIWIYLCIYLSRKQGDRVEGAAMGCLGFSPGQGEEARVCYGQVPPLRQQGPAILPELPPGEEKVKGYGGCFSVGADRKGRPLL